MDPIIAIVLIIVALAVGVAIGFILRKASAEKKIGSAEEQAKKILEDAIKNAENAKKESIISAKSEIFELKKEADRDINERRKEVSRQERRNIQKEETLDAKLEKIEKKEALLQEKLADADKPREEVNKTLQGQLDLFNKILDALNEGKTARSVEISDDERALLEDVNLLTLKLICTKINAPHTGCKSKIVLGFDFATREDNAVDCRTALEVCRHFGERLPIIRKVKFRFKIPYCIANNDITAIKIKKLLTIGFEFQHNTTPSFML
mgnify:CR=1 FL=1